MTLFVPRAAQSSRKLLLLLLPTNLLILDPLFDSRAVGFDGGRPRIMIALGLIECRLSCSDRLFTPLALLGLGGKLRPALGFVPLPLPLEIQCSFPGGLLTDFGGDRFPAFGRRFSRPPRASSPVGDRNALRSACSIPQAAQG
jgi:hypothetical protein